MVSPGIRTGYMILPADLAPSISKFAADTYISPSMFDQAVVVDFINKGYLKAHTAYLIDLFRPRLITLLDALDQHLSDKGTWTRPQGGYFVSFNLNNRLPPVDLAAAREAGLALSDGRGFFIRGGERFIRLPFCALDEPQIEEGIRRLARFLGE
jgi:DNA-binding transcriptional MocR family regulator